MIAPFFAAAHALTRWTNLSPDGFTLYYQHAAGLAGLCYVVAGMWFLRRLLRRHFTDRRRRGDARRAALGTSLYHYATFDSLEPRFSFCALRGLARAARRLAARGGDARRSCVHRSARRTDDPRAPHEHPRPACAFSLARPSVAAGLVDGRRSSPARVVVPAVVALSPATGHWIVSSYGSLGVHLRRSPHIVGRARQRARRACSSGRRCCSPPCAGFAWLPAALRRWRLPCAVVLIVDTYMIASWWDWQFGGSYGHRGFVDSIRFSRLASRRVFARAVPHRGVARAIVTAAVVAAVRAVNLPDAAVLARRDADERHDLDRVSRGVPPRLVVTAAQPAGRVLAVGRRAGGALWYLRDPPWLIEQTTGFVRPWERGADGADLRWCGGHASFFVPADAGDVRIPVAPRSTVSLAVTGP